MREVGLAFLVCSAAALSIAHTAPLTAHALRLRPGDDLPHALLTYAAEHSLAAAAVVSCVGSLSECRLRLAGAAEILTLREELEIVSLVGTLGGLGQPAFHLHMAVSRADGTVVGGHIKGQAVVRTTAEVVLGVMPGLHFARAPDVETGYDELVIRTRPDQLPTSRDCVS